MKDFVFVFFVVFFTMVFYFYYNLFLVVLSLEFVMLFIYFMAFNSCADSMLSYVLVVLLSCFFVLEAILSLNLLLLNYRFFGLSFFLLW